MSQRQFSLMQRGICEEAARLRKVMRDSKSAIDRMELEMKVNFLRSMYQWHQFYKEFIVNG